MIYPEQLTVTLKVPLEYSHLFLLGAEVLGAPVSDFEITQKSSVILH
jgi:hypothetical protein